MTRLPLFACLCLAAFGTFLSASELPPDEAYVTIVDGHLHSGGERVRFWGSQGGFPGNRSEDIAPVIDRLQAMGFNLARFKRRFEPTATSQRGDGSMPDRYDLFVATLAERGMRMWLRGWAEGTVTAADVDVIDDPDTAAAWSEAVGDGYKLHGHAAIWDPRLRALAKRQMTRIADRVNPYTGRRYGDEPTIAVWELTNEQWWFGHMVAGHWQQDPPFFQRQLLARWHDWLRARYGDEDALRERWLGLLPGESLDEGTIMLAPLRRDPRTDPQRAALGIRIKDGVAPTVSNDIFNRYRGEDVIAFLLEIWVDYKTELYAHGKTLGKSCRLSPIILDTGIGYEIQAQYMQQHGDATVHDTYVTGFHHDPTHRRFPWYSGLEELPRMCWQVSMPWVEQNKMPGKPQFIYETNTENPAKYRAEYPMRVASLGSIQDWDIVCWHYFGPVPDSTLEEPYRHKLDYTVAKSGEGRIHPQGYHYQYDEVQMSAMRAAAAVFVNRHLPPAPEPTTYIFGRKHLLDPASMEKGGSYGDMGRSFISTVYRHGVRLIIDPEREDSEIIGPFYRPRQYEPNPIRPTDAIEYDWQRGHLKFDAPGVASYTGFFAQHGGPVAFANGVTLHEVTVHNPEGMPYPVAEDERYLACTLVSTDGAPLERAQHVILSAVSTSFNTGFELDHGKLTREFGWFFNRGATVSAGGEPVLVARVGLRLSAPMLDGMRYVLRDWHLRPIGEGVVEDGEIVLSAEDPVFIMELHR